MPNDSIQVLVGHESCVDEGHAARPCGAEDGDGEDRGEDKDPGDDPETLREEEEMETDKPLKLSFVSQL